MFVILLPLIRKANKENYAETNLRSWPSFIGQSRSLVVKSLYTCKQDAYYSSLQNSQRKEGDLTETSQIPRQQAPPASMQVAPAAGAVVACNAYWQFL